MGFAVCVPCEIVAFGSSTPHIGRSTSDKRNGDVMVKVGKKTVRIEWQVGIKASRHQNGG